MKFPVGWADAVKAFSLGAMAVMIPGTLYLALPNASPAPLSPSYLHVFSAMSYYEGRYAEVDLNWDGSWTYTGDLSLLSNQGYGGTCLAEQLKGVPSTADPNPSPKRPTATDVAVHMARSRVLRPCLPYFLGRLDLPEDS